MLRDLQSRVKELEEKDLKSKNGALEEKQEFEKTIAVNSDTVKKLDKEINKHESSRSRRASFNKPESSRSCEASIELIYHSNLTFIKL